MRNLKLLLKYDGTKYHGYQRQAKDISIQEVVETTLSKLTKEEIIINGCSRTDKGVHASKYVCSFNTNCKIPAEKFPLALNVLLPPDISAFDCCEMPMDFHARFSAKSKIYNYKVWNSRFRDPFYEYRAWHYPKTLDLCKMREATEYIIGRHDFTAFMATGGKKRLTEKEIYSLNVAQNKEVFDIEIHANGYLYNMVRIIAGTLVYAGCGKIEPKEIPNIIKSKNRTLAGATAPPQGLTLVDVFY